MTTAPLVELPADNIIMDKQYANTNTHEVQMSSPPNNYAHSTASPPPQAHMGYQMSEKPLPDQQQQQTYDHYHAPTQPGSVPQMAYQQPHMQQQYSMPAQPVPAPVTASNAVQYQTATPIAALGMSPTPVDCPMCGQRRMTSISHHAGNTTHVWAVVTCCLTGCLCFIPYLMNGLKDVQHRCGNCGVHLATWHKSGQVEVHAHA